MIYTWKLCFVIEPLSSEHEYNKYWQSCFNPVFSTPMNICWLNFSFQLNFNVRTTLAHQHWIEVILLTLFQRCFHNVEATSINIRRLNFHYNQISTLMCLLEEYTENVMKKYVSFIISVIFLLCVGNSTSISFLFKQLCESY